MGREETEQIQRALNEAKKRELQEKYGGTFHSTDPNLPPEVEADWLRSIEEFEQQFEAAGETTVRRFIGSPPIIPLSSLCPGEVRKALDALLALLHAHGVVVDFGGGVPDREAYRFLTEELMDHEVDDIHIEGSSQVFLYEEFHPDDRHDATMYAEFFLRGLFISNGDEVGNDIAPAGTPGLGGQPVKRDEILRDARDFSKGIAAYVDFSVHAVDCTLTDGAATVRAHMAWEGLRAMTLEKSTGEATATVNLQKYDCGGWLVVGFGWEKNSRAL
jgi:hypothetical protein